MRAIQYDAFGPPSVLSVRESAMPVPEQGEVRVAVRFAGLNPKDVLVRKGKFRLFTGTGFPRTPGYDFAGVVESSRSPRFQPGDEVFGLVGRWTAGTCAEFVCVKDNELAIRPTVPMSEAAALPLVGLTALQALRDLASVRAGDEVVINGASGGLGTIAIQVARALGANVSAVCSRANTEFVSNLGATKVLPYDEAPLVERRERFDVVCDFFGTAPYSKARRRLKRGGRYVSAIPGPGSVLRDLVSRISPLRARLVVVKSVAADLETIAAWANEGTIKAVIDSIHPFDRPASAHERIETRRARGKVVIDIGASDSASRTSKEPFDVS